MKDIISSFPIMKVDGSLLRLQKASHSFTDCTGAMKRFVQFRIQEAQLLLGDRAMRKHAKDS